jgi:hypothetical protein
MEFFFSRVGVEMTLLVQMSAVRRCKNGCVRRCEVLRVADGRVSRSYRGSSFGSLRAIASLFVH